MQLDMDVERARLDAVIAEGPEHLRPLFLAVRDMGCGLAVVPQMRKSFRVPAGAGPMIVLVADDTTAARGPCGFHRPSLRKALETSRLAVVVSSGPEVMPYAMAATFAAGAAVLPAKLPNVVIVETRPEAEADWRHFIEHAQPGIQLVVCQPRRRGAH